MSQIIYKQSEIKEDAFILQGLNSRLICSEFGDSIWRMFHSHRFQDREKGSWSLIEGAIESPSALLVQSSAPEQWTLKSKHKLCESQLLLTNLPFTFAFEFLKALNFYTEPVESLYQNLPRLAGSDAEEDPHIFNGHPVRDQMDGLPHGAGLTLEFELTAEMNFYGLGERTGALNKRGRRWHNWTTDEFFHLPKADPLYQSHPFVMIENQGQWLALYLDESWYSCFDLGFTSNERWQIHTAGPTFDLYLIAGQSPQELLRKYISLVGKPPMPPLWVLGQHQCRWSYPDQNSVTAIVDEYRERDLPLDSVWMDIDYMSSYKVFTFSTRRFPDVKGMTRQFNQVGVKTMLIVDPGVKKEENYAIYESGHAIDAFVHNVRDEEFVGEVWPKPVVWPDFTRPEVRQWWGQQHQFYLDHGIAGIWNDMNEPAAFKLPNKTLPLDARQGAFTHAEVHNLYGYHMAQATFEGLKILAPDKRPFVLTRSGCPGIQRYAWVWTGDNASYWEHLAMSIPMMMNLSLSAIPFTGADIGGFSSDCDGELLAAWSWLGACYPFMRNHAGKRSRRQEPWQFGEPWLTYVRKALNFRYQLLPYLYTRCFFAHQKGEALFRPLVYDFPGDPQTLALSDQFMFGPDLMVAPITQSGQSHRAAYFPAGEWFDFWSGQLYVGGQWHLLQVSLDALPLFQRAGSAIPLQAPQLHTTDAYWPEILWQVTRHHSAYTAELYCDSGEGAVDGELQALKITPQAKHLNITRTDNRPAVKLQYPGGMAVLMNTTEFELPLP